MIIPASPSFYGRPETLQDAIDSVLARVLDHLGLPNALQKRWGQDIGLADDAAQSAEPATTRATPRAARPRTKED